MLVPYVKFWCPFPPRPTASIPPTRIAEFDGWLAQRKFNGTRTMVFVDPDGEVVLRTRHREEHRAYAITDAMVESIKSLDLDRGKWHVLDGELLHSKTTRIKDRLVLFDVLVHAGRYLVGTTVEERLPMLRKITRDPTTHEDETGCRIALVAAPTLWVAETFSDQARYDALYEQAIGLDELEGLVLKNPGGRLSPGVSEQNNGEWIVRVRKPHKNYRH